MEQWNRRRMEQYNTTINGTRFAIVLSAGNVSTMPLRPSLQNSTVARATTIGIECPLKYFSAYPCPKAVQNQSAVPQWYVENVVQKYDVACLLPDYAIVAGQVIACFRNGSLVQDLLLPCKIYPSYVKVRHLLMYYKAFYGIDNYADFYAPRVVVVFVLLSLYCLPLLVLLPCFSIFIIRKILSDDETHIFVYHCAILVINIIIFLINLLQNTLFAHVLMLGFCFMSPIISVDYDNVILRILKISFESAFCLSNDLQAIIAIDRIFGMHWPVRYHSAVTKRQAVWIVIITILVNLVIWVLLMLFNTYFLRLYGNLSVTVHGGNVYVAIQYIQGLLLIISLAVQAVGSFLVFGKIAYMKLKLKFGSTTNNYQNHARIRLIPCYLLIGTCVLNMGASTCVLALKLYYTLAPPSFDSNMVRKFEQATKVTVTVCCSCGFYIHCLCSSNYRKCVIQTVKRVKQNLFHRCVKTTIAPLINSSGNQHTPISFPQYELSDRALTPRIVLIQSPDNSKDKVGCTYA